VKASYTAFVFCGDYVHNLSDKLDFSKFIAKGCFLTLKTSPPGGKINFENAPT